MMKLLTELKFELLQIARALYSSPLYTLTNGKLKIILSKFGYQKYDHNWMSIAMYNIHHKSIINMEYICISGLKK